MRRRPIFWLLIGVFCLAAFFYLFRSHPLRQSTRLNDSTVQRSHTPTLQRSNAPTLHAATLPRSTNSFPYRLSNTTKSLSELTRSDHAILLENALFDTERRTAGGSLAMPAIPDKLRIQPSTLDTRHST